MSLSRLLPLILLTSVCFVLLLQTTDLTTTDVGRHLKNGEVILHGSAAERRAVLRTNFYSYTEPDFPFINHHWLTGVVFYLMWRLFSFEGLTILYAVLVSAAFLVLYWVAIRVSNPWFAAALAALTAPLIAWRAIPRPEGFTDLFAAIFYAVLLFWSRGELSDKWLYSLPVAMLLWVNLHIGFIFGFVILAAFGFQAAISPAGRKSIRALIAPAVLMLGAALINPNGIRGVLEPLNIFRNYGVDVPENQSLMKQIAVAGQIRQYEQLEFLLALTAALFILRWLKGAKGGRAEMLLLGAVGVLTLLALRNIPIFCLLALPVLSWAAGVFSSGVRLAGSVGLALGLMGCWLQYSERARTAGIGLTPGTNATADFLRANAIADPIFNDFNNGSYLIFHRFQADSMGSRVFVDGRPEAYPSSFFDTYLKMQGDEQTWLTMDRFYRFNAIVFTLRFNNAKETERFLLARIHDPDWAPVFTDYDNLVLLRRTEANMAVITAHEIPQSEFR